MQYILQGQPGSGKSTITRYIALIMAKASLDRRRFGHLPKDLLGLSPMFPLRVELSACSTGQRVKDRILMSVDESTPKPVARILSEEPVLFLFDGLDEVATSKRRNEILDEICRLTYEYTGKGHRFIVTTRSSSYSHRVLGGGGYALYRVDELAADQQEALVRRYYRSWSTLGQADSNAWQERANDLIDQLRNNEGLSSLCSNPLLLAQICYLHSKGAGLPSRRHEVYDRIIRHLVSRRDLAEEAEVERRVALLHEIAMAMYQQETWDRMSRENIEKVLEQAREASPEFFSAVDIDQIEKDWGVLVQRIVEAGASADYAFVNMSFQEYLVAHAVYRNHQKYWPVLKEHLTDDQWEEILLLYSAMAPTTQQSPVEMVVEALRALDNADSFKVLCKTGRCLANDKTGKLPSHKPVFDLLQAKSYEDDEISVKALEVWCQIEPEGPELILDRVTGRFGPLDQDLIMRLLRRVDDSVARQHLRSIFLRALYERPKLQHRIYIAEALAQVGDPRLGALIDVVETKGGRLKTLFKIGKYPVTNFEYSLFLQGTSRPLPAHWQPDGYPIEKANHPVTYVSLSDAAAYCVWLSDRIGAKCRLPSAEEWLIAARAGISNDSYLYPWGPNLQTFYVNFLQQVKDTTPVGIYLEGVNGLGIADLLGNVWEWTTTRVGNKNVLKGGAWDTMYELKGDGSIMGRNRLTLLAPQEN